MRADRRLTQADTVKLYRRLAATVRREAAAAGVELDTYDPDMLLGSIMAWLAEQDEGEFALTSSGIRRVRSFG